VDVDVDTVDAIAPHVEGSSKWPSKHVINECFFKGLIESCQKCIMWPPTESYLSDSSGTESIYSASVKAKW
jgi:hypothetical protein